MGRQKSVSCDGARPKLQVIDLFCGCGGFSLGAARAGFHVAGAIDNDERAIQTHKKNFPNTAHWEMDLLQTDGNMILDELALNANSVTGVIGGPPCQGFSNIGLRNVRDVRNRLFQKFFQLVGEIRPSFYLCENVPGILDSKYESIRKEAKHYVAKQYFNLDPLIVRASDYGAPTTRTRVIFVGIRTELGCLLDVSDLKPKPDIERVYVKDALKGLPRRIRDEWQEEHQGWRKVSKHTNGEFGLRLTGDVPPGVGDRNALKRLKIEGRVSGCLGTRHTEEVIARFSKVTQGELDTVSRFPRLKSTEYCPTLRAGTDSDRGSHQAARPIHPTENRVITPREAARLQGFPDWYQFDSTKWHSFRMIGNSISPILAEELLLAVNRRITGV